MRKTIVSLNTPNHTRVVHSSNSPLTVKPVHEPFLNFDVNSPLSFDDKSAIYCSLVALVKDEYPFDFSLQNKAVRFMKSFDPALDDQFVIYGKLVTDLVPSPNGSPSGFVESILTLLSSPHPRVVQIALTFLSAVTGRSSQENQCYLVDSDLITNVLAILQPHTLPISENETIMNDLIWIIFYCLQLATPFFARSRGLTDAVDIYNHREMILQKVAIPSSRFITFLISNRSVLEVSLFRSFMSLLGAFLGICPFHRPTLDFVLNSPIVVSLSSCNSPIETDSLLWNSLDELWRPLTRIPNEDPETIKTQKRMMQALISEGFEDTLQQMVMYRKGTNYGLKIVESCHFISNFLGMNVTFTENENEEEFEISDDEDSEEYDEEDSEDYDEETTEN